MPAGLVSGETCLCGLRVTGLVSGETCLCGLRVTGLVPGETCLCGLRATGLVPGETCLCGLQVMALLCVLMVTSLCVHWKSDLTLLSFLMKTSLLLD